jgi:hypothetical protein
MMACGASDPRAFALFFSTRDKILHRAAGKLAFAGLGSADKELVTLHNP